MKETNFRTHEISAEHTPNTTYECTKRAQHTLRNSQLQLNFNCFVCHRSTKKQF